MPAPSPGAPGAPIIGVIQPVPDLGPIPLENLDKCNCPRPKKQEKKKRKTRTVCSSGSYKQTANGLSKHATKYFDCATGVERPAPSKPRAAPAPRGGKKPLPYRGTKLPSYKDVFKLF